MEDQKPIDNLSDFFRHVCDTYRKQDCVNATNGFVDTHIIGTSGMLSIDGRLIKESLIPEFIDVFQSNKPKDGPMVESKMWNPNSTSFLDWPKNEDDRAEYIRLVSNFLEELAESINNSHIFET